MTAQYRTRLMGTLAHADDSACFFHRENRTVYCLNTGGNGVMRITTLCYAERNCCWLMMHRIKKDQDENAGKWIGIGGHLEDSESPDECILREAKEEAGLQLSGLRLRGIITFILPDWGNELTFLYTACADQAELPECPEGDLRWVPKEEVLSLPLWEGDRVFLPLLSVSEDCFSLKLIYQPGGRLSEYILDGVSCRL